MGVVISLAEIKRDKSPASAPQSAAANGDDRAIADGVQRAVDQSGILEAARPLLERCRDRYGFVVMSDGLPNEPAILARALLELCRGLSMLDASMGAPRTYPTFGVYFGRRKLAWFEDGYGGATGLAVPNGVDAGDLAAFVRPRIAVKRLRPKE